MIGLKEYQNKKLFQEKLQEVEEELLFVKEQLKKSSEYNKELEAIILNTNPVKKSKIITIKSATTIEFINVDHIIYCIADESYTHIELRGNKTITAAKPLTSLENILEGHSFFRISKSHLVNTDFILTFHKDSNRIVLQGDITLDVARRRRIDFLKTLK